jgi:hypothetical protein
MHLPRTTRASCSAPGRFSALHRLRRGVVFRREYASDRSTTCSCSISSACPRSRSGCSRPSRNSAAPVAAGVGPPARPLRQQVGDGVLAHSLAGAEFPLVLPHAREPKPPLRDVDLGRRHQRRLHPRPVHAAAAPAGRSEEPRHRREPRRHLPRRRHRPDHRRRGPHLGARALERPVFAVHYACFAVQPVLALLGVHPAACACTSRGRVRSRWCSAPCATSARSAASSVSAFSSTTSSTAPRNRPMTPPAAPFPCLTLTGNLLAERTLEFEPGPRADAAGGTRDLPGRRQGHQRIQNADAPRRAQHRPLLHRGRPGRRMRGLVARPRAGAPPVSHRRAHPLRHGRAHSAAGGRWHPGARDNLPRPRCRSRTGRDRACAAFLDAQPAGRLLALCGSLPGWSGAEFDPCVPPCAAGWNVVPSSPTPTARRSPGWRNCPWR